MSEQGSFEELLRDTPAAPAAGTVSLVGALEQSSDATKFVLNLQNGTAVTLETASVKGHAVLDTSQGRTIVRVDIDAARVPTLQPQPVPWVTSPSGLAPFSLAAPRQAPELVITKSPILDGRTNPLTDVKSADDGTGLADLFSTRSYADLPI
jgi:hypothetical protein